MKIKIACTQAEKTVFINNVLHMGFCLFPSAPCMMGGCGQCLNVKIEWEEET